MEAVDIRLIPCDERTIEDFAELESVSFPFPEEPMAARLERLRGNSRCPTERHFLAKVESDVVGGFRILPLEMRVSTAEDGWVQVGGLGRLSVQPNFRRQGIAGGVLRLVLQRSFEQGDVLSLLYPTSFRLYRKYGYAIASRHVVYSVPPRAFPEGSGTTNIRRATASDLAAVNSCYENNLAGSIGHLRRSEQVWRQYHLGEGGLNWVFEGASGEPEGFFSFVYQPASKWGVHRILVKEWFVRTGEALRAMLGFFRAQSSTVELVKIPTPLGFSLENALVEPIWPEDPDREKWHQPIGKLCSSMVGRIVRLRDAMAARQYAADGKVNLLVEDWSLPENSGYYCLQSAGGRGLLSAAEEGVADVRMDISVLSSLYCGAVTAREALSFGQIEATLDAARQLDTMLGGGSVMTWDYF
ncbi:MAG: GNAT family N-acetyltransferase [Myxococcales bacterium]|nr:GNAT family N-acetyltransferase [Myxococcales bacterium]